MKYRNQFLKFKLHYHQSPDDTGGGGSGDGNSGGEGAGKGEGNNEADNLLSLDTMWEAPDAAGRESAANTNTQGAGNEGNQPTADEALQTHIDSLGLTNGIDFTAAAAAMQQGDVEGMQKAFLAIASNSYKAAMLDSNKIVTERVTKIQDDMRKESDSQIQTGKLVDAMHTAMPFTKQPSFDPMAKAVLTQFVSKGATQDQAIDGVRKYFKKVSDEMIGLQPKKPRSTPSAPFGELPDVDGNDDDVPDWVEILGGIPST
jgi:hypothetical protein